MQLQARLALQRRLATVLVAAVIAMGAVVLAGWAAGVDVFKRLAPPLTSMNPTTASCFLLASLSLWLIQSGRRIPGRHTLARVLASVVLCVSLLRVCGYLLDFGPWLDRLLVPAGAELNRPIAPNTAVNLTLVAAALLLIDCDSHRGVRIAQFLSLLILLIAMLAMLGYVLHEPKFYGIRVEAPMSLYASLAFSALAGSILLCRPDQGVMAALNADSPAGVLARWLLPAAVIVPALLGWLQLLGERHHIFLSSRGVALTAAVNMGLFILLISWNAVTLNRADHRRRILEESVRKSEAFYVSLVETVPQAIFRKDLDGRFTFANRRFCDAVGLPLGRIVGRTDFDLFPKELAEKYRADDRRVVETGQVIEITEHVTTHDDTVIAQTIKTPVRDDTGAIIGTQGVFWDVTDRLRFQQQLQEKNQELAALASAEREAHIALKKTQGALVQSEKLAGLGQMVAGVAHEINNPLAFVSNNVAVLMRDIHAIKALVDAYRSADGIIEQHAPQVWAQVREQAERIDLIYTLSNLEDLISRSREGLRRIQQIVRDLRDFARLDTGDLQETDLNRGIESTVNIVRGTATKKQVQIDVQLSPLPPVVCYPAKINQVVMNLLANAIDACADNGRVHVRTATEPGGVRIEVIDDGCGIPPDIRTRIFDPFFTTKPPGEGTGLGLSISYGIIEDHRGAIEVDSEAGKGSTFIIHLPLKKQ
ncbi:MAG: sensor histidine kinase [Tepidisphaerales bacterium]